MGRQASGIDAHDADGLGNVGRAGGHTTCSTKASGTTLTTLLVVERIEDQLAKQAEPERVT